jgi:hypothetical protein
MAGTTATWKLWLNNKEWKQESRFLYGTEIVGKARWKMLPRFGPVLSAHT